MSARNPAGAGGERGAAFEVDLFGAPIGQIKERWGRPSFRKTKENQELVALLRANGWSQPRIARHLGCDEKTLRKHFSRELEAGADLIEGMALQVLLQKMRQGHTPSTREVLDRIDRGRAAPPVPRRDEDRPERLGKKEQAQIDAGKIPEGWGDRLKPVH